MAFMIDIAYQSGPGQIKTILKNLNEQNGTLNEAELLQKIKDANLEILKRRFHGVYEMSKKRRKHFLTLPIYQIKNSVIKL